MAAILLSLDGILVRMKDAPREKGLTKEDTGPKGHMEVGCATVSTFDSSGKRLRTVKMARMPESKKPTLEQQLHAEAREMVRRHPNAIVVGVADGDPTNWEVLGRIADSLGVRMEKALDFYHALEHVAAALRRYRGRDKRRAREDIKHWAKVLKTSLRGPQRVIEALVYRPRRVGKSAAEEIGQEISFVRRHLHLMPYSKHVAAGIPIGSGVQEAACKTLVGQRMKLSGMSWRHTGGQGILTLRGLAQSSRLKLAWNEVGAHLRKELFEIKEDGCRVSLAAA